jgi:hypothetical protein
MEGNNRKGEKGAQYDNAEHHQDNSFPLHVFSTELAGLFQEFLLKSKAD